VVAAFEELADEGKRRAYDRQLEIFGRRDGMRAKEPALDEEDAVPQCVVAYYGAARVAQVRLLATPPFAWQYFLSQMDSKALEILSKLLRGIKVTTPASEDICREGGPMGKLLSWQGPTNITRLKTGYKVVVTWESLSVCTGFTRSLTQALDWQIALLGLRSIAQERMRSHARSGVALTEDELLKVLESEPSMDLAFTISVELPGKGKKKGKAVSAPAVPDLQTAMDFRRRFLEVAGAGSPEAPLQREKRRAEQEATELRKRRKTTEQTLSAATTQEVKSRAAQATPRRQRTAAREAPPRPPCRERQAAPQPVPPTPRRSSARAARSVPVPPSPWSARRSRPSWSNATSMQAPLFALRSGRSPARGSSGPSHWCFGGTPKGSAGDDCAELIERFASSASGDA